MMTVEVRTPRGHPAQMAVREGTSDLATVGATFEGVASSPLVDEYGLRDIHVSGWALDVGAHIGSVTLALLIDNPDCRVVAIEALPENVDVLRWNLALNEVEHRCTILTGAAWKGRGPVDVEFGYTGSEIAETNAYIGSVTPWMAKPGNSRTVTVPRLTLQDALDATGGEGFEFTKIDCEGCEHYFLKGRKLAKLGHIIGEWHYRDGTPQRLADQLAATHDVTWAEGIGGGPFAAVPR